MSKKEKDIELIPDSTVASGWKVRHDGKVGDKPGNGPGSYPKVEFPANSGPHLVVFKIQDAPGVNATFNLNDPMWVQPGSSSPTQQGMDSQIADWAVFDGGKTLVLLDLNSKAGELSYRVKADGYDSVLDPIIKNGGGTGYPPPPSYEAPSYSLVEIGVAGLALIVALTLGYFWGKRA